MSGSRPGNLVKVYEGMIKTDQELLLPLYNAGGELLAQKGTLLNERQAVGILRHGDIYTIKSELIEATKGGLWKSQKDDDDNSSYRVPAVFRQLEGLVERLIKIYHLEVTDFIKQLDLLVTNFLKIVDSYQEACIASIVLSQNRDIFHHALQCAILAHVVAQRLEWETAERISLVKAAFTMDFVLVSEKIDLTSLSEDDKLAHQKMCKAVLSVLGVKDQKWLEYVSHHHGLLDNTTVGDVKRSSWGASILTMADTFCSRLSGIYGGEQIRPHEVFKYMNRQFVGPMDSLTFDALVSTVGVYPLGSIVLLNNGEVAVVTALTRKLDLPVVRAIYTGDGTHWRTPMVRKTENPNYAIKQVLPVEHFIDIIDLHQFWQ